MQDALAELQAQLGARNMIIQGLMMRDQVTSVTRITSADLSWP